MSRIPGFSSRKPAVTAGSSTASVASSTTSATSTTASGNRTPSKSSLPSGAFAKKGEDDEDEDYESDSLAPLSSGVGVDHIKVCVRIRPMIRDDRDANEILSWTWDNQTITQDKFVGKNDTSYTSKPEANAAIPSYNFDHIFVPDDTNDIIYDAVIRQLVGNCMEGYHGSVFSYGQTSSGKTFTMNGTSKQPGIIPLAVYDCFALVGDYEEREFLFRASYLEVYNEQVKDLLNPDPIASANIKIQSDPKLGTVISGVKEQVVANAQQVMALLQGGESHRHVGSTNMNEKSSRAHTLFRLKIESKERFANTSVRVSTLNLIDLAGSENARMTGSTGDRAKEAKFINQSLLTLSLIIQRLSEESSSSKKQHLPYRDSKLTRILQEPLSGNALIAIICTMSPALRCADESNNTLRFATRAKKVNIRAAHVNEDVDDKALLKAYRQEIEQLKAKLAEIAMEEREAQQQHKQPRRLDSDFDDEEGREKLLQMIDDMERFIVKADVSVLSKPTFNDAGSRLSFSTTGSTRRLSSIAAPPHNSNNLPLPPNSSSTNGDHSSPPSTSPKSGDSPITLVPPFEVLETGKDGHTFFKTVSNMSINLDEQEDRDLAVHDEGNESPSRRKRTIFSPAPPPAAADYDGSESPERSFFAGPNLAVRRGSIMQLEGRASRSGSVDRKHLSEGLGSPLVSPDTQNRRRSFLSSAQSGEVILQGVAHMLQSLKAQVARASLGPNPGGQRGSLSPPPAAATTANHEELENLKLDIKLKDADSRFLQEELERKEQVMVELTEGLKEVALTHEQWAVDLMEAQAAYEAQTRESEALRDKVIYLENCLVNMESENSNMKARIQILESVLRRKDKQIAAMEEPVSMEALDVAIAEEEHEQEEEEEEEEEFVPVENTASWKDVASDEADDANHNGNISTASIDG